MPARSQSCWKLCRARSPELITESVSIPTIGIGAGVHCDIQVLVLHDMLGLSFGKLARFVRPYANLHEVMTDAVTRYADDVRNGTYPSEAESYALPAEAAEELDIETPIERLEGREVLNPNLKLWRSSIAVSA